MIKAINSESLWKGAYYEPRSPGAMSQIQRMRLMRAMVEVVAAKGYQDTTVADVLRKARVSRRTFYELFTDKEDCFAATYLFIKDALIQTVQTSQRGIGDVIERMEAAHCAYLDFFYREQAAGAAVLGGIARSGIKVAEIHSRTQQEFADMHAELHSQCRSQYPELPKVPNAAFLALVEGTQRLVFTEILAGRTEHILNLLPTLLYLSYSIYGLWSKAACVAQNWDGNSDI